MQNDLAASQAQLAQINDDLANLNEARTKQDKADADKAATLLTNDKQQTAQVKADLVTAKQAVLDAKKALADKQAALVEANNEVDRLTNADSILEAAKHKFKTGNAKSARKHNNFAKLKANNKFADDNLNEAKTV